MKITIDTERQELLEEAGDERHAWPLHSPEAFERLSRQWLAVGWTQKYTYSFTWLGRPIIQLPEDMFRIQEVIYSVRPDVIIETGVAHGGSLIFYASLCKVLGHGRVIGVDIDIRAHNRAALEAHPLFPYITLVQGSSIETGVVAQVHALACEKGTGPLHAQGPVPLSAGKCANALVLLDSCHTKDHVLAELNAYAPLVGVGSYLVAMDGIMGAISGAPRTQADWTWNNPAEAARTFASQHPEFLLADPPLLFNESTHNQRVTYWPSAYLRRLRR